MYHTFVIAVGILILEISALRVGRFAALAINLIIFNAAVDRILRAVDDFLVIKYPAVRVADIRLTGYPIDRVINILIIGYSTVRMDKQTNNLWRIKLKILV